jgi:hypothetical protein
VANVTDSRFSRFRRLGLTACLFVMVLGLNWAAAERFGSDMPDWDQWDAEGLNLIAPWFEHDHFVAHLFQPHNEHRVVITKLQNLAVLLAAGQWDERLECFFNAFLHAGIAVGLWVWGRRWLSRGGAAGYYVLIGAIFALPLAWQNLLGGFHSQQYWLIGLSFIAIVTVPFARRASAAWWAGIIAAILAMGSMGSGFFAAGVIAAVVAWRWLRREIAATDAWPTLVLMAALVAVGLATRVEVDYHEQLKAKTVHDFMFSLWRSLEWPWRNLDWAGAILWLPLVLLAWRFIRTWRNASPVALTILALNGWVLVQLLATAYVRGAGANYPASRYMDTLIFATALNGLGLGWLWATEPRRPGRFALSFVAIVWATTLGAGLHQLLGINLDHELIDTTKYYRQAEGHLRSYLATNDPQELRKPIPYPSAEALIMRLGHPSLRQLQPESVRPALPLTPAAHDATGLLENHAVLSGLDVAPRHGLSPLTPPLDSRPTWGSYTVAGVANTGVWRSAPLAAPLQGWLKFETAGDLGADPNITLELRDATTGVALAAVQPAKAPHATWRSAFVRAPHQPFVVVATDRSPTGWLAFSAPVEISPLSYLSWRTMKNGVLIAEAAAALALALAGSTLFTRKTL